jgi:hypothetical protein
VVIATVTLWSAFGDRAAKGGGGSLMRIDGAAGKGHRLPLLPGV